jgi:hypothetical protein
MTYNKYVLMLGFRDKNQIKSFLIGEEKPDLIRLVDSIEEINELAIDFNCQFWIKYNLLEEQKTMFSVSMKEITKEFIDEQ